VSERRYRFGPLEERRVVGPLRGGQLAVLGFGALAGLGSLYAAQSALGLLAGLLLLGLATATICVPLGGRTVDEWAPVAALWALRRRRAEGGYRSSAPAAGVRVDDDGEAQSELSLPPGLGGVELLSIPYGGADVGVLRERAAGTYTPRGLCPA
jgi:hypothetical protein